MRNSLKLEYIAVFYLIFLSAGVSIFSRSLFSWDMPLAIFFLVAISIAVAVKNRINFSEKMIWLFWSYIVICLIQFLWYGSYHLKHLIIYPIIFFAAYSLVSALGTKVFEIVEDILFYLVSSSLVIWLFDVISAGWLRSVIHGFYILDPYGSIIDSYILLYTVVLEGVDSWLYRNSGFAWEPGAFAVFVSLGLLLHALRTRFRLANSKRAVVFFIALISSQSTTGYSIFLVMLILYVFFEINHSFKWLAAPISIILFSLVISLPFMQDKVLTLAAENVDDVAYHATRDWNLNSPVAAQRILSLQLDYEDFKNSPVFGYGGRDEEMIVYRENLNIVTISGVGKILAKFGVVGFLFFIVTLAYSSLLISRKFGLYCRGYVFFFILMVGVSYSIIEHPLFVIIWLYAFIEPNTYRGVDDENNDS